jgi:ATP-binding cassette subfamily C (CFTR/MRP) protein 1
LDVVKIFTSLALINLVANPASRLLSAVPLVAGSVGCLDRIQEFLVQCEEAERQIKSASILGQSGLIGVDHFSNNASSSQKRTGYSTPRTSQQLEDDMMFDENDPLLPHHTIDRQNTTELQSGMTIVADHADIALPSGKVILHDVNISIKAGSMVCITGSTGAGKSVLMKALLGEIGCVGGSINHTTFLNGIGYCSQAAWIPHGAIKDLICGTLGDQETIDEEWYRTVIEACSLSTDIKNFTLGDQTEVGSRGSTLSGGQKQRIALARAIFQRPSIFLLDSVFTSLDIATKTNICRCLLGPEGLLASIGSTVVLVTYDGNFI